ncbi:MAG: ABC transporter substrate-binding protein [Lachnospiraceae bacterium]|nr:ABC transporter substrate-binding protein [Lachnospiraceae bacterium]
MFKNRSFKALVLVLVLMINCFALVGCGKNLATGSDESRKITLVLDWTPNTNHTGIYVAVEKGYFAQEGIIVEVVQPPEDGAEVLVASGKAELGISFQDTLAPALIGEDALEVTAVAAIIQHNTSGVISRKGEGMDRPSGMEGKSYSTWNGSIELAMIENVVEADGGDFSKVELIPSTVTDEVSALNTKTTDSIWIFYGWAGVKMELEGIETDYFAFKDINPVFDYYSPVLIANNDFLAEESEYAEGFLRALKKGYEYAIEHPEEAAQILCDNASELDYDLVLASQQYLANEYKAEVDRWGYIDPARWNAFYNWLSQEGLVEDTIPENTGFSNDYLPE